MCNVLNQRSKASANYFYNLAKSDGCQDFTIMKVIKLVYIAHGWTLALTESPLVDEPIQAWQYGAVVPSIYNSLKFNGTQPIEAPIFIDGFDDFVEIRLNNEEVLEEHEAISVKFSKKEKAIMERVWSIYGAYSGWELSDLIHKKGTPWTKAWTLGGMRRVVIRDEEIKKYYKSLIGVENGEG